MMIMITALLYDMPMQMFTYRVSFYRIAWHPWEEIDFRGTLGRF
jgi:hypothetical protein